MLEDRNAVGRIENAGLERQLQGVAGRQRYSLIVRGRLATSLQHLVRGDVDAGETDLRQVQTADGHFGQSLAAADVENPVTRTRTQALGEELGEIVVPPGLPQMLQRGRREAVDQGTGIRDPGSGTRPTHSTAHSPGRIGLVRGSSPSRDRYPTRARIPTKARSL